MHWFYYWPVGPTRQLNWRMLCFRSLWFLLSSSAWVWTSTWSFGYFPDGDFTWPPFAASLSLCCLSKVITLEKVTSYKYSSIYWLSYCSESLEAVAYSVSSALLAEFELPWTACVKASVTAFCTASILCSARTWAWAAAWDCTPS